MKRHGREWKVIGPTANHQDLPSNNVRLRYGGDLKGLAERGDGIVVFQVCDRFEALFGGSEEDAERFLNCLWAEGALSVWQ